MKKRNQASNASRRDFLKQSALGATAVLAGYGATGAQAATPRSAPALGSVLGANDRLTVGFIGVGGQGFNSHVMNVVNKRRDGSPRHEINYNVEGAAACDVYSGRRDRAKEALASITSNEVNTYKDYREVLDRDDIDAVFIGTVDHWHAQIAIDAMDAGKHVYCEKPMTRYLGEAFAVHDKVKETGKIFQIGSQYCTEGKWHVAADMIKTGKIGPLVLAQDSYMRNNPDGEWNYELEPEITPETLDWKMWLGPVSERPFDLDGYHRWRKYYPYCAGILGDLLAHRIHPLMIATGSDFPTRVACLGTRQITPDRDVPDNTQVMAEFANGLVMMVTGATVNEQGLGQVIRGHEATLYFSGNTLELRPERPFADLVDTETHENIEPRPSIPHHIGDFFDSIRDNTAPNGNIDVAIRTQVIISMAEMSERLGMMLHYDAETRKITNGAGQEVEPITYGTLELS